MALSAHVVAAQLRAQQPGLGTLKLHKLLYYCQGHHLAWFGRPIFEQTVSAWDNGPVVGELWYAEKRGLPATEAAGSTEPGEAELNTIGYVLSRYGKLSGRDLVNLTHGEEPWRRADEDREPRTSRPIDPKWMIEYFRGDVGEDEDLVFDSAEVKAWLRGAEARRDLPAQLDDADEIARRLAAVRARVSR